MTKLLMRLVVVLSMSVSMQAASSAKLAVLQPSIAHGALQKLKEHWKPLVMILGAAAVAKVAYNKAADYGHVTTTNLGSNVYCITATGLTKDKVRELYYKAEALANPNSVPNKIIKITGPNVNPARSGLLYVASYKVTFGTNGTKGKACIYREKYNLIMQYPQNKF